MKMDGHASNNELDRHACNNELEPPDGEWWAERWVRRVRKIGQWAERWVRRVGKNGKAVKEEATELAKKEPRKLIHSLKVGMALTVVSLLYLLAPLFGGMGQNYTWAVLTVILVLELTAGATLYKGINRGLGTLLALCLAFLIQIISHHVSHIGRAICISLSIFLIGSFTTYARFIPSFKKNYDYAVIVFLITFNVITVGTYHAPSAFHTITERLYTIAIGCGIALITSLFILPNWSGEYLHKSIISKFEELAKLLQECVDGYFQELDDEDTSRSPNNYLPDNNLEKVWQCISMEDPWAKFTSWEPRHSRYCYPSKQYVHLGVVLRHLGYTSVALCGCLESHIQAPQSIRALFREPCKLVAEELIKVLMELAETIKNHHQFSPHISDHLHEALEELDAAIKAQPQLFLTSTLIQKTGSGKPADFFGWQAKTPEHLKDVNGKIISRTTSRNVIACLEFSEALPFAAFVSLLVEMVARLDHVIEAVEELGKFSHFKEFHEEDIEIMVTSESVNPSETGKDPRDSQKLPIKVQSPVTEIKSSTASTSEI